MTILSRDEALQAELAKNALDRAGIATPVVGLRVLPGLLAGMEFKAAHVALAPTLRIATAMAPPRGFVWQVTANFVIDCTLRAVLPINDDTES
jgi:hypothetical protein